MAVINESIGGLFAIEALNPVIVSLIVPIIILLLGFIIGRIIGKLVQKSLRQVDLDRSARRSFGISFSPEKLISRTVTYFVYLVAVIMALNRLEVTTFVLNVLAAAVVLIAVIAFILAIKDFVPNAMAGIVIRRKKMFRETDKISVADVAGRVTRITLTETKITTRGKDEIFVPNSFFLKHRVKVTR
jgi:small-conductance mechanosensitive channel